MSKYLLERSPVAEYAVLVFSTSAERPQSYLSELAIEFRKKRVRGLVCFDLFASNASYSSRFFSMYFNGEAFGRVEKVKCSKELIEASAKTYVEHFEEFDFSLLTPATRFALSRGVLIKS